MSVVRQNYRIEGFLVLLNEDCITSRYYPLIPFKETIVEKLKQNGLETKDDCAKMTNNELMQLGIADNITALFKGFLNLYDFNENKLKAIRNYCASSEEKESLFELARLPGIQLTRALLYYNSGYKSLSHVAKALPTEIIDATTNIILSKQLQCKPPFLKEVKTHIAVAKVLTDFAE